MALYKDGNPVSGLNSIPRLTLAQYNALNVKPEFWVRTDAPESYKKLSADQVSYDSNNTVKDKLDWVFLKNMSLNDTQDISSYNELILVPKVAGNQPFNSYHWLKRAMGSAFYVCSIESESYYFEAHFTLNNDVLTLNSISTMGWGNACNVAVYGKK